MDSGDLSAVYPPALNQAISLDSLLDRFHSRLQEKFTAEFGQPISPGMPLLLSFVRADIQKVQSSVNEGFESIRDTIAEGVESMLRRLDEVLPPTVREPTTTYWLDRPGSIEDGFVGRKQELEAVDQNIKTRRLAVISGGAGSGKSRLAAEYAHRSRMNGFWTTAGNKLDATLTALAPSLGIDIGSRGDEKVAEEVRRALAALPPENLWVIDNLESLEQVNPLLNAAGLRLLITSRDDRSQELSTNQDAFQRLPELDPDTAIQWLATAWGINVDDSALEEIAQLVGCLPLALEMLAIRRGGYGQTPERVRDDLKKARTPIQLEGFREAGGTTIDYPQGVYNAITGTLEMLPPEVRAGISSLGYRADAPMPCYARQPASRVTNWEK